MPPRLRIFFILAVTSLIVVSPLSGQTKEKHVPDLCILYTSDMHGHLLEKGETIGIDRIATIKNTVPHALLLDAGDFLHGTPLAVLSKGQDVIRLMKAAGYFAATAGNHEFDYGRATFEQRVHEAATEPDKLRILSANIKDQNENLFLAPAAVTTVNNIKVCVFGLTTPHTPSQTSPSATDGLVFTDPLVAARAMVAELQAMDCRLIVALTHLGSDALQRPNSRDLGREVAGINVIIDGHSHVLFEEAIKPGTLLIGAGEHGKTLGMLQFFFDPDRQCLLEKQNHFLSLKDAQAYPPDPLINTMLADISNRQHTLLDDVVGLATATLPGSKSTLRTGESALGNLCADSLRLAAGTEIALINSGAIRTGLRQGLITRGDLLAILPFSDTVYSINVSGKDLLQLLEHGFSRLPEAFGGFPQISGMVVWLDLAAPPGMRVRFVFVHGQPLVKQKNYSLAINGFVLHGGDGYLFPDQAATQPGEHGSTLAALEDLVHARGAITPALDRLARIFPGNTAPVTK